MFVMGVDRKVSHCELCPALCASRTQIVKPTPCPAGGLLVIGEGPGAEEDFQGVGFVGAAGRILDALMADHGIGPNVFGKTNAVRCRPPSNRKPTKEEIENCRPLLFDTIAAMQPKVLLLVGASAAAAVLGRKISVFERITEHPTEHAMIRNHYCELVITPHFSPLCWRRYAPNGERWSEIGRRQVKRAVDMLGV